MTAYSGVPRSDRNQSDTFAAVGRAISQWEKLEALLSILYSIFDGRPRQIDAMQEYGKKGRIFVERLKLLETSAERFFQSRPNQSHEGTFCEIVSEARALSHNRHQIAHGVVDGILTYSSEHTDAAGYALPFITFAVVPPWYAHHRLTKAAGYYGYGSADIDEFALQFMACANKARDLASCLHAP